MQNYEKVKQCMLAGQSTEKALFHVKRLGATSPKAPRNGEIKYGLGSFLTNLKNDSGPKRPISQISKEPVDNAEFISTGKSQNYVQGRFRYKFQEGHSKNFKREMPFDWFV
jgi:hypothetical protein